MNRKTLKSSLPVSLIVGCNLAAFLLILVTQSVVSPVHYVGRDKLYGMIAKYSRGKKSVGYVFRNFISI